MNKERNNMAVLFDMDGVIVDNIPYHLKALKEFCRKHIGELTDEDFKRNISGKTNKDVFHYIFKKELTMDEIKRYEDEKESLYRELYKEYIEPQKGLIKFLKLLKDDGVKAAVATSGPKVNLDFVLGNINIVEYFDAIVYGDLVAKGKPDPEIYLTAANAVGVEPKNCIVIEDALNGIVAGQNAGMKVIGMTTVHTKEELKHTDFVVDNFEDLTVKKLQDLFK